MRSQERVSYPGSQKNQVERMSGLVDVQRKEACRYDKFAKSL